MPIRAIVFDIGGVLEITPRTGWDKKWEQRLGLQPGGLVEKLGDVWRAGDIGQISEKEMEEQTREILGLSQEQLDEFLADTWHEYLGTLNAELAEYFRNLRPRYQTAIISNSFVGAREKEHKHYGFGDICDFITYSHEVGVKKPNPSIYEMTWQRLGIQPSEMIFVDDWPQAIEAAIALGIHGILFQNTVQTISDIQALLDSNQ